MAYDDQYRRQVALLLRTIPFVAAESEFALKGGTAINLFVRNLPRLSVDIDLTYLPVAPRAESLVAIDAAMRRMQAAIAKGVPGTRVNEHILRPENIVSKLLVQAEATTIKIEVTPVSRGCAYDPVVMPVTELVEAGFGYAETQVVSFADLYAGKIVAALDRQHPRDLFDVRDLLANEGVSDELRAAFIVYMLGHNRPMAEVLAPHRKDIALEFDRGFVGMTAEPVALDELLQAREAIITEIVGNMPDHHREFLVSFERGSPVWDLLEIPHAATLPAIQWRELNLAKLDDDDRHQLADKLEAVLFKR